MEKTTKYVIAGVLLLCAVLICSPVSALKAVATDEQLKIMNELEGTDITIGEYMQKVWPEFYAELDDEQKEKINNWKKSWSDNTKSVGKQENTRATSVVTAYATKGNNRISYGGSSTIPDNDNIYNNHAGYHYIEVKLKNSADVIVSTTAFSNTALYVDASNLYMYPASGLYRATSWAYSLSPDTEGNDVASLYYN